jgi:hypothetical protein
MLRAGRCVLRRGERTRGENKEERAQDSIATRQSTEHSAQRGEDRTGQAREEDTARQQDNCRGYRWRSCRLSPPAVLCLATRARVAPGRRRRKRKSMHAVWSQGWQSLRQKPQDRSKRKEREGSRSKDGAREQRSEGDQGRPPSATRPLLVPVLPLFLATRAPLRPGRGMRRVGKQGDMWLVGSECAEWTRRREKRPERTWI